MVDRERLSTARLMMKLKFIRKQSEVSKIHHQGQAVLGIPPTTC
jgi:hypothetical protein